MVKLHRKLRKELRRDRFVFLMTTVLWIGYLILYVWKHSALPPLLDAITMLLILTALGLVLWYAIVKPIKTKKI